ncbi:MAG: hypothetical protein KA175_02740 [Flavobacteriales bacterium]|nr:hypothetical protein [Flavobacteriales bacterium]MBP6696507.1 hypothetical protein [Flavobacteriales bacterium]
METSPDIATAAILSTLVLLFFIGAAVILLIVVHNRRTRHRAEMAEVRVRHAEEVRSAEREVMNATLAEVGRDLHDNIGQLLTVVRMGLNEVLRSSPGSDKAAHAKETLDTTIAEVRRLSRTLNTDRWNEQTLAEAMRQECERIQRVAHMAIQLDVSGSEHPLSPDHKVVLFRIFQEAVNNSLKHARATCIDVSMSQQGRLCIKDNGAGFMPGPKTQGQGLANMQRRAGLIGYHCTIASIPGEGTAITITPQAHGR